MAIDLTVNGRPSSTDAPPAASLLWVHHAGAAETSGAAELGVRPWLLHLSA